MYEYLIGSLIFGVIWLVIFLYKKDLRKSMLWTSIIYILLLYGIFFLDRFLDLFINMGQTVIPYYWNPQTLFNIGQLTKGASIEDGIFMFFAGGLAASLYEIIFKGGISKKTYYKNYKLAIIIFVLSTIILRIIFKFNPIYHIILVHFIGSIVIIIQRKDLIKNSIYGGLIFLIIYFILFKIFMTILPNAFEVMYNIKNLSQIYISSIPIEELVYAFSFGLMWCPIYKYLFGYKIKSLLK